MAAKRHCVSAVPTFVSQFDNTLDEVALLSFSSNARIDFPIGYNFITPITNDVAAMNFVGGTFGTGGALPTTPNNIYGPPLSMADAQNNSVTVQPGQNVIKVVVYFTDGLMNASQDYFYCGGAGNNTQTLINYGGYDSGAGMMSPSWILPAAQMYQTTIARMSRAI